MERVIFDMLGIKEGLTSSSWVYLAKRALNEAYNLTGNLKAFKKAEEALKTLRAE